MPWHQSSEDMSSSRSRCLSTFMLASPKAAPGRLDRPGGSASPTLPQLGSHNEVVDVRCWSKSAQGLHKQRWQDLLMRASDSYSCSCQAPHRGGTRSHKKGTGLHPVGCLLSPFSRGSLEPGSAGGPGSPAYNTGFVVDRATVAGQRRILTGFPLRTWLPGPWSPLPTVSDRSAKGARSDDD